MSDKLSFSHYCEIIWNNDFNKINYYIQTTINHNLSVRQLRQRIKSNEYERLTEDLGKGYTFTALTRMRKFYHLLEKLATVSQQLSYGHYIELFPYDDINKIQYYIKSVELNNLSIRQLRERIKSNEYERLTEDLGKGYTETNLKYFRQFYYFSKSHTMCDDLSWSHYRTLLPLKNEKEIEYYIYICKNQRLSVRMLKIKIKK